MFTNTSATVFLSKKIKINKRFCFRFKKKRGFDFENFVKSKAVKPYMPTLTPKILDLLFMTWVTWHSWKEPRKPKPKRCSHAGTICPLQFKSFSCCSCIFFFWGLNKKNEKNLAAALGDLHMHWCTYIDERERERERESWRQRDEKLEKGKRRN